MLRRVSWLRMGKRGREKAGREGTGWRKGGEGCMLPRGSGVCHSHFFKILHLLPWLLDYFLSS